MFSWGKRTLWHYLGSKTRIEKKFLVILFGKNSRGLYGEFVFF